MIVSRAPVRFSLGGGGTDLPSYASEHGGFLIAAAIDRYVYVNANVRFYDSIRLSYSKTETVDYVDFGVDAFVVAPPRSETIDIADLSPDSGANVGGSVAASN